MPQVFLWIHTRELHGEKKSSPFPPRTQYFVPITAATAVMLLRLSPSPWFYRGYQCKFQKSCPHYRCYRSKNGNPFPITAVFTAVIPRGNTVQVSYSYHTIGVGTLCFGYLFCTLKVCLICRSATIPRLHS